MNARHLAVLAALALAALGFAACGSSGTSSSATTAAPTTNTTIDAKQLFVAGDAATGAAACGSCHVLKAAGTSGTIGPDLDKSLAPDDHATEINEMIVKPNGEVVEGYKAGVMPATYSTTLTAAQIDALATYIDANSAHGG